MVWELDGPTPILKMSKTLIDISAADAYVTAHLARFPDPLDVDAAQARIGQLRPEIARLDERISRGTDEAIEEELEALKARVKGKGETAKGTSAKEKGK